VALLLILELGESRPSSPPSARFFRRVAAGAGVTSRAAAWLGGDPGRSSEQPLRLALSPQCAGHAGRAWSGATVESPLRRLGVAPASAGAQGGGPCYACVRQTGNAVTLPVGYRLVFRPAQGTLMDLWQMPSADAWRQCDSPLRARSPMPPSASPCPSRSPRSPARAFTLRQQPARTRAPAVQGGHQAGAAGRADAG